MKKNETPKVLLLGNGINRAFADDSVSLKKLLDKITTNKVVGAELDALRKNNKENGQDASDVPFPLEIIMRTDDNVDFVMKNAGKELYGAVENDEQRNFLRKILSMGFDHILTTNYSYELEMASLPDDVQLTERKLQKFQTHTDDVKRAETQYLMHTYNTVEHNGMINNIWHIHGEARKPGTMIIGHYYYGNLLYKYKNLLNKRKNTYKFFQERGIEFRIKSWIDAFIIGDVYMLGFGMDFSELDLWWLINRKKRENAMHGKIVFYEPEKTGFDMKKKLLEDYEAEVKNLGYSRDNANYKEFYKAVLDDIEMNLAN